LSYRRLAAELGVAHSHIAGIEAGAHKPSADLVLKIARFFQVSADQLMDDKLELE
jgi:transcriptional regulator with XRE-family HTH domain